MREEIIITRQHEKLAYTERGQGGRDVAGPYTSAQVDLSLSFLPQTLLLEL